MSKRIAQLGMAMLLAVGLGWLVQTAVAAAITTLLYDGSLGTLPAAQGFTYLAFPVQGPTQVISNNGVILNTTAPGSDSAGYFNRAEQTPTLNRSTGYTVTVRAQVLTEAHNSNDRAGFSLIALSDDLTGTETVWGIELGFWEDEIWAQDDDTQGGSLFTHAEGVNLDTTTAVVQYDLYVVTETYRLAADGVVVLSGRLRDYSNFSGFPDPYESPNFIFLGDDTSSAAARVKINEAAVSVPLSAPPPPRGTRFVYLPLMIRP